VVQLSGGTSRLHRIHGIFETLEEPDIQFGECGRRAFICLGNTVGNYVDTVRFIGVLKRVTRCGDLVVLGYQLDTYARKLFEKYKANSILASFVRSYATQHGTTPKLQWSYDEVKSAVQAHIGRVLVFYSRKFSLCSLPDLLRPGGFQILLNEADQPQNVAILVARRR